MAKTSEIIATTADIVSAHVSKTSGAPGALPDLIPSTPPEPLICLGDGRRVKFLQRQLRTKFNLPPNHYRATWSLPTDYPTVAPNLMATRSHQAKSIGPGRGGRRPAKTPVEAESPT
jgi:predicted transcriptional regulator